MATLQQSAQPTLTPMQQPLPVQQSSSVHQPPPVQGPSQAPPNTTQALPVPNGPFPDLLGYQALGSLMGGFPDFAIYRRFSDIGALDLCYRQAELQNCVSRWAAIATHDRKSMDGRLREFDIDFGLFWESQLNSAPDDKTGDQWRMWTEVSEKLGEFYDRLLKFQQVCNLPSADKYQLRELREHLKQESGTKTFMRHHEYHTYSELYDADFTSIAMLDEPDVFNAISRGRLMDWYHELLGVHWKQDLEVPHVAIRDHQKFRFNFKRYSPDYILKLSRVFYAAGVSILVTSAIVTLNYFHNVVGRFVLIGVHNLLFTVAAALCTRGKPGELFAIAAAYAAVLVVFASGSTGMTASPTA